MKESINASSARRQVVLGDFHFRHMIRKADVSPLGFSQGDTSYGSRISNGGKTSLTEKLCKCYPGSHYMCQDDYFVEEGDERLVMDPELNHANWESFDALDMEKMLNDLTTHLKNQEELLNSVPVSTPHFVFVEGFTIFNYCPMIDLYTKKYFITLTKQDAEERRSHRVYEPPDVPGYFDKFVWPMYVKHKEELLDQKDIVYLDGTETRETLCTHVLNDLKALVAGGNHQCA